MNKLLFAAFAVAATIAVAAAPLFAQSENNPAGGNPAANAAVNPGATAPLGGTGGEAGGMPEKQGRWGMGRNGPGAMPWKMMMGHMAMRHRMMGRSPQAWCEERLARRAGLRAYVAAKLDLTAAQRSLWRKVQAAARSEAQAERQLCDAMKPGTQTSVIDRLDRMQRFLTVRLDGLKQAKPAVEALYKALTPEQRKVIDHPFRMP
ncbi:MAG TPA: Spy/CpxP family protein refolding chaperone [Stellaceae bacterium]|nr:Spy/CpxP family protein refolding chaperone [Stellaceae bacterium]